MKVIIIGGGIAGLCAAVYAQRSGYQVDVLERNQVPGGLANSWQREGYTFETCLHWLLGSRRGSEMHARWQELFDIHRLRFVHPEILVRLEDAAGQSLNIYTDLDRLEEELLRVAPQDTSEIHRFLASVRRLCRVKLPDPTDSMAGNWLLLLTNMPHLALLQELSNRTSREYARKFKHPLLRAFFSDGEAGRMSTIALFFSLAWMSQGDADYPIGGSQAVIRALVGQLATLGGNLHVNTRVDRILVEQDRAVGVHLASGETLRADWIISAADGHTTIYDLLSGKYTGKTIHKIYEEFETFPSYAQVSLGIARDLSAQPWYLTQLLPAPFKIDPGVSVDQISFRFFHYDPTFAPAGRTVVTCTLPTRNYEFWVRLQNEEPERYAAEKQRLLEAVTSELERRIPNLRSAIEVTDVCTPASVIRHTGNWKGSMEGWLLTPHTGHRLLPNTLPGLHQFYMVGQWIMPGGGLPSGPMTARPVVQAICRHDHVPFAPDMPHPTPAIA